MVSENPTYREHDMDLPAITTPLPTRQQQLRDKAQELEAAFLSEMLAHSGLSEMEGAFGGGQGEAQFTSFLRQEQAQKIVQSGGLGLAELIFKSMTEAENAAP
jgi:Rod binding domain-containing protein